ncbi:hypothetical protein V3C99_013611 [Haemonchus contortus]|uniref:Late endosomal/lysosomal adaptor and MAPK and MTOR activator 1 n=1 Tax=Haemonchus contortus TaxID=6289 RepID=A0A7I5E6S0_HAECO|nr:Protein F26F4.2 [Haemonchus contortus]CDJ96173.1 Protein F26F4.2 [Haemonchus contortus]
MSAFSAKVVQHSINQLLINTINDAEKMLLDLPRDGDRVEVITSSSHEPKSQGTYGSGQGRTTQDVVVDTMTPSKTSDEIQRMLGYPESSSTSTDTPLSQDGSSLSSGTSVDDRRKGAVYPAKVAEDAVESVLKDKAEIVPGSIQVSPLRQMAGILIDLIVMIKMKSGGSRTVNMQIECPNFTPKRIRIDGSWHSIV